MSDDVTKEEEVPAPWWGDGDGGMADADMAGDPTPGAGANIRFWMPKGTDRKIIFLTDGDGPHRCPPPIWEHQLKIGGHYRNWFTCVESLGVTCPACKYAEDNNGAGRRYRAALFTIIDTHEFEDRSGTKRKNVKKLLVAKKDSFEMLKRKWLMRLEADPPEALRGALFRVFRSNKDTSPSIGDDYEFQKMVDLDSLPDAEQFDYAEMLKPDVDRITAAVARLTGSGGGADEGTSASVEY